MRHFCVNIEYDGTDFHGFQSQPGRRNVQDEVERCLFKLTRQQFRIQGAGRTDTGVHALGQVISFKAHTRIPVDCMVPAINSELPRDIRAVAARETDDSFNARFSARSRSYIYVILNRPAPSAIFGRYAWHVPEPLDLQAMQKGADYLIGHNDFRAWSKNIAEQRTTVRHLHRIAIRRVNSFVLIRIDANAFLHGMVRNIVGTLEQVASGKRAPEEIAEITCSLQRSMAGPSAPARGLCLVRVRYD